MVSKDGDYMKTLRYYDWKFTYMRKNVLLLVFIKNREC